jgi:DNA-binding CsgD family transcriptional regulator
VASLLSEHLDAEAAQRLAASCHAMTGGNPLLVTALGEDSCVSADEPVMLVPRSAFRSAIVMCLHRYEPRMVELAQAVAVLGESATPTLLAELLEISLESATHGINALDMSGLLESGQFRHKAARQAVLEHMAVDERAAMHGRAALMLYGTGAEPTILARHLVGAPTVGVRWTVPVLQHLPDLVTDAHAGLLDNDCMDQLAYYLLWVGDTSNAAEILGAIDIDHGGAAAEQVGFRAHHIRSPLNFLHPELAKRTRNAAEDAKFSTQRKIHPRPQDGSSLATAFEADGEATVVAAERVLQERSLNDPALASVTAALMALICEDMLDRAAFWCNALMRDSGASRGNVLWHAMLTGFWAMIETRRGDLPTAENHARTALALLTRKAWGVAIGGPLSSLLLTAIASRKHGDAAACLRIPVPEAMFGTPYGLLYLYARGEYYLATGCPQAALADFTACGDRMIAWGLDQPGLVPWRTKAAEAYLAMGDNLRARELSREQLAQVGSRSSRIRGISLRALALASHPSKRTALLRESVEVLRDSGARLELAYTFNELSNAHLALGEHNRAHWAARQAGNLAERCGAQALKIALSKADLELPEPGNGLGARLLSHLSDAEQRVAMLAACGYTNTQIARKLYITVSTVEQHLTRVYRKLGVAGRAELPIGI